MKSKLTSFTQLAAWKEGHKLVLLVYKAIKKFPQRERFGLSNQMTRAAVSITSNIAEGFARRSIKEKKQFYFTAKASLVELQNQLIIARDIGYLKTSEFNILAEQTVIAHKLLNGLIRGI